MPHNPRPALGDDPWGAKFNAWIDEALSEKMPTVGPAVFGDRTATSNLALRAAAGDAVVYVTTGGNNANDGLSWGTAKGTVQAAIDALPAAGGTVKVGAGTFTLGTQTAPAGTGYAVCGLLVKSFVTIRGRGRRSTIFTHTAIPTGAGESYFAAICNADTTNGNTNIYVTGVGFDLPAPLENATGMDRYDTAVAFAGVSHSTIERCWIRNGSALFHAKSGTQNTASVLSAGANANNRVLFCDIEQMTQSLMLFQGTDCQVVGCWIDKAWDDPVLVGSAGAGHRILANRINAAPVVANKGGVSGVIFATNDGGAGGDAQDRENMRDIVIAENVLFGNTGHNSGNELGIALSGGIRDLSIVANHVYGNKGGIWVTDGQRRNILVRGNHVFRNTGDGIRFSANILDHTVTGAVEGNAVWNNTGDGINCYSNGTVDLDLNGNRFYDDQGTPTQTASLAQGTEAGKTNTVRGSGNRFSNTTAHRIYGVVPPVSTAGTRLTANVGLNPKGAAAITVGASPFTHTASDYVPEAVYISGGTVSAIAKNSVTLFATTDQTVWLEPGESVTVTYSAAPTMTKDRK